MVVLCGEGFGGEATRVLWKEGFAMPMRQITT